MQVWKMEQRIKSLILEQVKNKSEKVKKKSQKTATIEVLLT